MMSKDQPVYESTTSYYDQSTKKWITGRLVFTERYINFYQDDNQILNIPFNSISSLEKRQSSLIYAAVVVTIGPDKHWFASLPNRDSLYNLLELFWREALLSKEYKTSPVRPSGSSNLGKDLLSILHESETTLINAANSLTDQGKQIEETLSTVEDINSDLNVAERFLRNMSLNQSLLQMMSTSGPHSMKSDELQKCFKVSYILSETLSESSLWHQGKLLIGENISLVDENKVIQISFGPNEFISCRVISKWKCRFEYTHNGERVFHIMCPKLLKLMKFLNFLPSFGEKITYLDSTQPSSSAQIKSQSLNDILNSSLHTSSTTLQRSNSDSPQLQEDCEISAEDMEEISNVLTNLQALATEVNKEQQEQLHKIDSLMMNAEKTELRVKADIGKIQKQI